MANDYAWYIFKKRTVMFVDITNKGAPGEYVTRKWMIKDVGDSQGRNGAIEYDSYRYFYGHVKSKKIEVFDVWVDAWMQMKQGAYCAKTNSCSGLSSLTTPTEKRNDGLLFKYIKASYYLVIWKFIDLEFLGEKSFANFLYENRSRAS